MPLFFFCFLFSLSLDGNTEKVLLFKHCKKGEYLLIKNIIFDMGGVLIDYDPEKTLNELFDKETAGILLKEIFRNEIWAEKDRGTVCAKEIIEAKKDLIPAAVFPKVCEMVENFYPYMPPFEKMHALVKQLKSKGYGIYLLSNASSDFHLHRSEIPALSLFDGVLISADHKLLKPEKEIYEALYKEFNLNPEECFFIDDVEKNIDGAAKTGMSGHCYSHGDIEILKKDLVSKGIL